MPAPQFRERRIHIGGLDGVLSEAGSGYPVVFLPSMLVGTRSYRRTIFALVKRGYHVISAEMPGSSRGSRLMHPWGFEDYGNWLCQLLEQLNLDRPPILIGHSDSAGAAVVAAAKCGPLVGKLVLCAGVGFDLKFSFWRIGIGRLLDVPLEPDFSMIAAVDIAYNMCRHFRNFYHHCWICTKTDLRPYAEQVVAPTLLAWGGRDHTFPRRCAEVARKHISNSRIYISREGSHDWLGDHAEEFAAAVHSFAIDSGI